MTKKTKMQTAPIFRMITLTTLFVCFLTACDKQSEKEKTVSGTVTVASEGKIIFMYSRTNASYPDYCTFTTDLPAPDDRFIVTINTGESTGNKVIDGLTAGKKVVWTATVYGKPLNHGSDNFVHIVN